MKSEKSIFGVENGGHSTHANFSISKICLLFLHKHVVLAGFVSVLSGHGLQAPFCLI